VAVAVAACARVQHTRCQHTAPCGHGAGLYGFRRHRCRCLKQAGIPFVVENERQQGVGARGYAVARLGVGAWERASGAMKRVVLAMVGYTLVGGFFAMLLVLELCFIVSAVVPSAAVVYLVTQPLPAGDAGLSMVSLVGIIVRAVQVVLFGVLVQLGVAAVVMLPYFCVTGWKSGLRQPADPALP
jgi:hypothetical protein